MTVHTDRLSGLRARMAETGTDLVALGPTSHMRWLAGLDPHGDERPVMLLVSAGFAGVLMPSLNADSARQATDLPFFTWADATGPDAALADLLAACDATRPGLAVAVDEAMRADFALRLLDALPSPRRSFASDTVGALRLRKDETEIDGLRASARLNDDAARLAFDALEEGMTELDVQAAIHAHYKAHGATPEFTIVGFGANGAFPHHHTGSTRLARDRAVLIDTGCRFQGYPSDMTRCRWFGTPDPEFTSIIGIVERAVQAALAAARPGVPARDVDHAARRVIEDAGYGDRFLHRTGHGLGIDIHEPPYITSTSDTVLQAGNVFSIEPGIYLEGRFGVRLEDIVVLREQGPEILSTLPRTVQS
ncbi:Aminopeptidase YpdF (MP-, MA-, MS-, AP-, NP- specific) [Rubellimicrobium mesophilum DSM 19309]|uniref:Aminopeptidase YpdF (MP-, MA-, MS-, AP-, NP-specific) n=1 Tax=Rubellimicrobium mesophilum DSM 19309 TaxID=442562 RepID=A0A017HNR9_9RHOB|nr:Xaa-Pro peptidase family protein [Rubellimicrobium mesophilum]EYD76006.1 Aminopeptidase YpdF (MP-, MA-, MS-, AP-, NP- specific) [Rubellimicrobium mesophilum DSM 19309]